MTRILSDCRGIFHSCCAPLIYLIIWPQEAGSSDLRSQGNTVITLPQRETTTV